MNDTLTTARRLGKTLDNCLCDSCPAVLICFEGPTLECAFAAAMRDEIDAQREYEDEMNTQLAALSGVL